MAIETAGTTAEEQVRKLNALSFRDNLKCSVCYYATSPNVNFSMLPVVKGN